MKSKFICGLVAAIVLTGLGLGMPSAYAVEIQPRTAIEPRDQQEDDSQSVQTTGPNEAVPAPISDDIPVDDSSDSKDTFTLDSTDDIARIRLGSNYLVAGNNVNDKFNVPAGIVFAFGNQLSLNNRSDYAFVAGNEVTYSAQTTRDLFIAGNVITIPQDAKIGRDVFAAGNSISLSANLDGDFSATANTVTINNVRIDGNVNLTVNSLNFVGDVEIAGKLTINADAVISDSAANVSYNEVEKFELVEYTTTAADIWISKIFSITGLFVAFAILMALFPQINRKVSKEVNPLQFAKDLFVGFAALFLIPICALFLIASFFAAPAGIMLLIVYLVTIFITQAFTGLYLGKIIVEKIAKSRVNGFVEALIGIIILAFAVMIPYFGPWIGFISLILGFGLVMQCLNQRRSGSAGRKYYTITPEDTSDSDGSETESTEMDESDDAETSDDDSDKSMDDAATNKTTATTPSRSQSAKKSTKNTKPSNSNKSKSKASKE